MNDLINRATAIKLLRGEAVAKYPNSFCLGLFAAADEVNKLPAVDAVEVVRCGKCKHGEVDDPDFPHQHYCRAGCGWNDADFFCACGERREDDG